jgi:hypothetical protein
MSIDDNYSLWFAWYPVRLSRPEWDKYANRLIHRVWMRRVFRQKSGGKTFYSIFPPG